LQRNFDVQLEWSSSGHCGDGYSVVRYLIDGEAEFILHDVGAREACNLAAHLMNSLSAKLVDILANAVRRNVVLDKSFGAPRITKDGVTVAKEIELEDKFENMGAQMVREVASKTSDSAGDGTTTATIPAHAIVKEGAKYVAAGMNPMDLKRGVDLAVAEAVNTIEKASKKVKDSHEIAQVGTVSANGDNSIGKMISEAEGWQ